MTNTVNYNTLTEMLHHNLKRVNGFPIYVLPLTDNCNYIEFAIRENDKDLVKTVKNVKNDSVTFKMLFKEYDMTLNYLLFYIRFGGKYHPLFIKKLQQPEILTPDKSLTIRYTIVDDHSEVPYYDRESIHLIRGIKTSEEDNCENI